MDVGDHEAGGSWMTYREIAAARRVKLAAAVRLVQRHKWRRQTGNDGTARILVPIEWIKPSDRAPPDIVHDVVPDADDDVADDVTPDRGILAGALAALEAALMDANKRADAAQVLAERTLAELADANARADIAIAGERQRADTLRDRLDDVQRDLKASEAIAGELRANLDAARAKVQVTQETADAQARLIAARRSLGLLARLRAAWRGE
jgi:hypothetical protein